jgi:hypothetical protein
LNYRIDLPKTYCASLSKRKLYHSLVDRDQLQIEMSANRVFCGYTEAEINFMPTYRFATSMLSVRELEPAKGSGNSESDDDDDDDESKEQDFPSSLSGLVLESEALAGILRAPQSFTQPDIEGARPRARADVWEASHIPDLVHGDEVSELEIQEDAYELIEEPSGYGYTDVSHCETEPATANSDEEQDDFIIEEEEFKDNIAIHRGYNLKRVPSYCDRVLWYCNLDLIDDPSAAQFTIGLENAEKSQTPSKWIFQNGYKAIPGVDQSDHIPVQATFSIRVLKGIPAEAYIGSCSVYFGQLKLTVDPSIFVETDCEVYLLAHGSAIVQEACSSMKIAKDIIKHSGRKCYVLEWPEGDMPSVISKVADRKFMDTVRFFISLCDSKDTILLQANIPLFPASEKSTWSFYAPAFSKGVSLGSFTGKIAVDIQ